jgi:archaellum biogenesis protein FlaJ (TadC family)
MFGLETGSQLANQSVGIFFDAINLGGDPERSGNLTSAFSLKAAMLRAQRRGISATFMWLTLVMHFILSGLMVFLLGILEQFAIRLDAAMAELGEGVTAQSEMGLSNMFAFNTPQLQFLSTITVGMIFMLAIINAFAIVGSEGAHVIKITFFLFWLFVLSGICFLVVPPLAAAVV